MSRHRFLPSPTTRLEAPADARVPEIRRRRADVLVSAGRCAEAAPIYEALAPLDDALIQRVLDRKWAQFEDYVRLAPLYWYPIGSLGLGAAATPTAVAS